MAVAAFAFAFGLTAIYPILRWGTRALWRPWELLLAIPPFCVWIGLLLSADSNKSFSNLLLEPVILGLLVGCLSALRLWLAAPMGRTRAVTYCALLAAGMGWLVWWMMPGLRE
jgi:hypothetical protein